MKPSSAVNALLPIAILVAGVLIFDNDLIHGLVLALVCQFVLYIPQKVMTVSQFFEVFFNGAKGMTTIAIIKTILPYAAIAGVLSCIGFTLCGMIL